MPQQFTTSDGLTLAYFIDDSTRPWTQPDTLVLLHAAMGSSRRLFGWIPRLSAHYRVVRMDMRGHGQSQIPGEDQPLTMERLVQDVVELLDHLGCDRAHVAGNSAGGFIGQNLAIDHPDRVRSLMVFSAPAGLRQSKFPEWLKDIEQVGLRQFVASGIRLRLPVDRMDPQHVEFFLDEAGRADVGMAARMVMLMSGLDWTERLSEIRCPTLIVKPGLIAQGINTQGQYESMAQRIPNAHMITYEGLPHHVADSDPQRCVDDVLAFLRWHFGAPYAPIDSFKEGDKP